MPVLISGCGEGAEPTAVARPVMIFAATSTSNAMEKVTAAFEQKTNMEVLVSYAASSTLARQIEMGAAADLFLSANAEWVDRLEQKGLVAERCDLLKNKLVVIVPKHRDIDVNDIPNDLLQLEYLALADPEAVPAGIYAREALESLNVWEALQDRVVAASDVRSAMALVERGEVDAGFVYATDAMISPAVQVVAEIESPLHRPIVYPLSLITDGRDKPGVTAFYDFLLSEEADEVFEEFGFLAMQKKCGLTGSEPAVKEI